MRMVRGPVASFIVLALVSTACALPDLDDFQERPLAQTSFLYAADGSLITALHAAEDRVVLSRREMPASLRSASVAIEDRRFYDHHGVDPQAVVRAAFVNAAAGEVVEGGSTITQQLVKNLYVGDAPTLDRKFDEALLAWQIENRMSKDQILTRYLNTVYFGQGAYGAQAAARTYFGVDAAELSLAESALLAGLISAPNHFDPYVRLDAAIGRRTVVLRLMRRQKMITRPEYLEAKDEPVRLPNDRAELTYRYPYFVDYFKRWFLGNPHFGSTRDDRYRLLFTGGLRITTTLDPSIQTAAERALHSVLAYPSDPDGAVTVLDPRSGYVKAMVGGNDADYWAEEEAGRVNLATGAGGSGRQTGSAFKIFALLAALENGISPTTTFPAPSSLDVPLDSGGVWHVTNAGGSGYGSLTLRAATVNSVNTVYAQLVQRLRPETVIDVAERMGMRCCRRVAEPDGPLDPYLSAVLGANEANTLEMASAYGTLANGGRRVNPIPVITVTDAQGNILWEAEPHPKQVLTPEVASAGIDILRDVVLYGTGSAANIGRPQFGKTGTDDNNDNAWFIGAIPQLAAAVWVGYHEGQIPMRPPRTRTTVYGGTWPAQIWRLLMLQATDGLAVESFPTPTVEYLSVAVDITQQPYCLPNEYTLPLNIDVLTFISGTQPTVACGTPTSLQEVIVPSVVGFAQPEAADTLAQAGFYVEVEFAPSTQPEGTVIYQTPSGGLMELQTSTVTVTLAAPIDPPSANGPATPTGSPSH